ncbi:MAG: hypothetical protein RhofKO_11360 [Rhodothermales bacterium]
MLRKRFRFSLFVLLLGAFPLGITGLSGCDHGLEPPPPAATGAIEITVRYPGPWPPPDSLGDLRFVAMEFIPQDTSDFLQLNRLVISDRLAYFVESQTLRVENVKAGVYIYNGVAQNFEPGNLVAWRPVGLVETNDGVFEIRENGTTTVEVTADFYNRPVFPPVLE